MKDLWQQQKIEELERATANFQEKLRRNQDGTPPDYQAYYEANSGSTYYISNASGDWIPVQESGVKRYLMIEKGVSTKKIPNEYSPLDQALYDLHTHYSIGYAGKLAGTDREFIGRTASAFL